jgi:hypothetical protein
MQMQRGAHHAAGESIATGVFAVDGVLIILLDPRRPYFDGELKQASIFGAIFFVLPYVHGRRLRRIPGTGPQFSARQASIVDPSVSQFPPR